MHRTADRAARLVAPAHRLATRRFFPGSLMESPTAELQACEWLLLRQLEQPRDNSLRIVVEEARAGALADVRALAESMPHPEIASLFEGARRIEHSPGCKVFEIGWDCYIANSVTNESYVVGDEHAQSEGPVLVRYTKSRFLDYVGVATFANPQHPAPFTHWGGSTAAITLSMWSRPMSLA